MDDREPNVNTGLKITYLARDLEKKGCYDEAAQKYKEAREFFKKIGENKLYAKCLAAHAENMIKYYLSTRDIESFSHNIIDSRYIKKIEKIRYLKLDKLDKYNILITEFQELEKIFKKHCYHELKDKVYYEKTRLQHKQYWEKAKKDNQELFERIRNIFLSFLHLIFNKYCGHGVLIIQPIFISLSVVFIFSFIFCCFNLIKYANPTVGNPIGWLQSFYFSVITFTTLGFGDIIPINCIGQALATIEVMLGYLLLGTLIAILIRRITR